MDSCLVNSDCVEIMLPQKECMYRVMNVSKDPHFMHMAEVEREESGGLSFAPALLFQFVQYTAPSSWGKLSVF